MGQQLQGASITQIFLKVSKTTYGKEILVY